MVFNQHREALGGRPQDGLCRPKSTDGPGGTGQERLVGLVAFGLALRLPIDGRVLAVLDERLRRQLPAGVAVDAGGIHEEVASNVGLKALGRVSHSPMILPRRWLGHKPVRMAVWKKR